MSEFSAAEKQDLKQTREDALRWANKVREGEGRDPLPYLPCGYPGASHSCPLAHATSRSIWLDGSLPPEVEAFVVYFDKGFYPDLVAEG